MCLRPVYIDKQGIFADCRSCSECRLKRSKEWACRLYNEQKLWDSVSMITLTYAPDYNPVQLQKTHVQNFIKRLRKMFHAKQIKYFACGEYGETTKRPHYHIILFGVDFAGDRHLQGTSPKGYQMYVSPTLAKLWQYGIHTIQAVTLNSLIYCALYTSKPPKCLPLHLQAAPEFNLMSQGLGVQAIISDIDIYMQTDEIYIDGQSYKIPQAVLNKLYVHKGLIVVDNPRYYDMQDMPLHITMRAIYQPNVTVKAPEYVALKEQRLKQYKDNNPLVNQISDALVASQARIDTAADRAKAINDYYQTNEEYQRYYNDRKYTARKKIKPKTI